MRLLGLSLSDRLPNSVIFFLGKIGWYLGVYKRYFYMCIFRRLGFLFCFWSLS